MYNSWLKQWLCTLLFEQKEKEWKYKMFPDYSIRTEVEMILRLATLSYKFFLY